VVRQATADGAEPFDLGSDVEACVADNARSGEERGTRELALDTRPFEIGFDAGDHIIGELIVVADLTTAGEPVVAVAVVEAEQADIQASALEVRNAIRNEKLEKTKGGATAVSASRDRTS